VSERVRVAVILGGRSSEHDISLASARSVLDALDPERYDTVTVEVGRDGRWELGAGTGAGSAAETLPVPTSKVPATLGEVDVVFPVLHGPFGEDGTVQGLLELAGVPYVGAGVLGSALAMDKDVFKAVMRDRGIPVTRNITIRQGGEPQNPFGFPVFVKPARLGSSVGISKAHDEDELAAAVTLAFEHDEKVLVEEFVEGVEVECGVLGNELPEASLPGGASLFSSTVPPACHSQQSRRCPAVNRGQRQSALDLRRSSPSQLTIPPELALQAGGQRSRLGSACRARLADRSLVAGDRSAGGVRDRTGPDPSCWSVVGPQPTGEPWTTAGRSGH